MNNDKGVVLINGVYLDYDYKIKVNTNIYYIKINLCGNGVCTKDKMGAKLHKLSVQNNNELNDIINCINEYDKFFYYKIITYQHNNTLVYFIYVMRHNNNYIINNNFSDLD